MRLSMNGPLTQLAAVLLIGAVAIFPSPKDLREAVQEDDPTDMGVQLDVGSETVQFSDGPYDDETVVTVTAPIECFSDVGGDPDRVVGDCAYRLASFIASDPAPDLRSGYHFDPQNPSFTDPEVEQARRALVEICRARWASGIDGLANMEACEALR